ncbi:MAG: hypothetical protein ACPGSI_16580 [Pikeienuella sp.]
MAKVPITKLPIDVYTPVEIGRPYVAFIRGLDIVFRANSPVKVRKAASEWRANEVAKEEARKAAKEKRLAAAKEARAAKAAEREQ